MFKRPGNYFFIVPWIAFIPWYGMLIAMLICWAAQGHPIYWFMHTEQFPVYISDIGATNLRPLFISCAGWQGLGYVITVACEFFQRSGHWPGFLRSSSNKDYSKVEYHETILSKKYFMPPYYTRHERNLIFAAVILGGLGEVALLMCTIFSTALYHHVHLSMVGVFVVLMFFSVCCQTAQYFMMGRRYALFHPLSSENPDAIHALKWYQLAGYKYNKFIISASMKVVWLALAVVWAICFAAISDNSKSACFEWLLAFWFGVLFMIISWDFYMGGRYMYSKYFHQIEAIHGYYKYDSEISSSKESSFASTISEAKLEDSADADEININNQV